jgi:hypothetical protein
MDPSVLFRRIADYAAEHNLAVSERLGVGIDGIVYKAECQAEARVSALKAYWAERSYFQERDAYLRLRENDVRRIRGCSVPQLVAFEDTFQIVEMTFVTPPFVLDFAKATLDRGLDFSEEAIADWHEMKTEEFEGRWSEVLKILRELEMMGIYMNDASTRNISLPDR